MNIKISGFGQVAAGEYESISISGSGRLTGNVRCAGFHISGAASGEALVCKNDISVSGDCRFTGGVEANSVSVSGAFSCAGPLRVAEKLSCSGSISCESNVKCATLSVSGCLSASGDIEAEKVDIRGKVDCTGLLNAEEVTITTNEGMEIGSIGGSAVAVARYDKAKRALRIPLLAAFMKSGSEPVYVRNAIEADVIALENVTTPRVSGRIVVIGEACNIDLVQYSEHVEISPNAKVGRTEQII